MSINLADVNYAAVAVAALVTFFLGAVWYSLLFGKLWIKFHGFTEEKVKEMQASMSPPIFFGGMLLADFVIALVVALLIAGAGVTSVAGGLTLAFLLWLGPAAAIHLTSHLASDKHIGAYLIDIGYQLVYLLFMGALLTAWR